MPDYSLDVLPKLVNFSLETIHPSKDLLLPKYDGYSLVNIPSTICRLLGVPGFGEQALAPELLPLLGGPYKRIILLVVDAFGFNLLNDLIENGYANLWKNKLSESVYFPLTSCSPSTTASALTSFWTGVSPAEHGIIGYEMWAKEFGMVINNILHSATSFLGDTGGLKRAGFDPNEFLNQPTLGTHLNKHEVQTDAFMHYSIGSSGLSSMHLQGVNLHNYVSESDMWVSIRNILNNDPSSRRYIYAYWSVIDTLMHRFSYKDERIAYQFADFSLMIEQVLINQLTSSEQKDTLLIMTADHGSVITPKYAHYDLRNHPVLLDMLRMQPTCENRLAFLYIKPGMEASIRQYFETAWPDKFLLIDGKDAISAGLFGSGNKTPSLMDRVGDIIAIAREDAYLWWAQKQNPMLGRHGGLHPEEMLVPFFAIPL